MARTPRPKVHEIGDEPDVRFSYANERTFLAWNRTALANEQPVSTASPITAAIRRVSLLGMAPRGKRR